ncbi:uncharacterized protein LOC116351545 [Contarinia nasturtii]|uniref:uncharacterized protein LOC116351545 n=1 Tax=Contarinia nasturtii TaxID=265458 RepID=UPI0012D3EAD2|nr:uncharacterized protein LOC116351545 [Contarinia nasturtii]XP_031639528.1 uncharacterized protein LOC116351545 [Contarinia nasturtii]
MLEPYQPKFQQQHRSSCPLVEMEAVPVHKHPSFSRISMGCSLQMPPGRMDSGRMGSISGPAGSSLYTVRASPLYNRNRQNSVFVGPQFVAQKPSRKYQSAMDIHTMVLDEAPEPV